MSPYTVAVISVVIFVALCVFALLVYLGSALLDVSDTDWLSAIKNNRCEKAIQQRNILLVKQEYEKAGPDQRRQIYALISEADVPAEVKESVRYALRDIQ